MLNIFFVKISSKSTRCRISFRFNGITGIINANGNILDQTEWWVPAVIKGNVRSNNELTFYVKHGDFLGRIAAFIAPLLLLLTLVKTLNKTQQRLG